MTSEHVSRSNLCEEKLFPMKFMLAEAAAATVVPYTACLKKTDGYN